MRNIGFFAALTAVLGATPMALPAQGSAREPGDQVLAAAAREIAFEAALKGFYRATGEVRESLEKEPVQGLPIPSVWIVTPKSTVPWSLYVARCGERFAVLGGARHPDLRAVTPCVRSADRGDGRLVELATQYAMLLDPTASGLKSFGAEWVNEHVDPVALDEWNVRRPENWPHDTIATLSPHEAVATVTRFFEFGMEGGLYWRPAAFTFLFLDGEVVSWGYRDGPNLPARRSRR